MPELLKPSSEFHINWLEKLFYYCVPAGKLKVQDNIDLVFQDSLSADEKKYLAMAFYSDLITSIKEIFLLFLLSRKRLLKRVELRGIEHLIAAEEEKGIIILTGHLGNGKFTSVVSLSSITEFKGKCYFIRKMKSSVSILLQRIICYNFRRGDLHIIEHEKALSKIGSVLKTNNAVVFVMDERAPISINTKFCGVETAVYSSMAAIVGKFKTPVSLYPLKNHKQVLEFHPEVTWQEYPDKKEAIYKNTLVYTEILEKMIYPLYLDDQSANITSLCNVRFS